MSKSRLGKRRPSSASSDGSRIVPSFSRSMNPNKQSDAVAVGETAPSHRVSSNAAEQCRDMRGERSALWNAAFSRDDPGTGCASGGAAARYQIPNSVTTVRLSAEQATDLARLHLLTNDAERYRDPPRLCHVVSGAYGPVGAGVTVARSSRRARRLHSARISRALCGSSGYGWVWARGLRSPVMAPMARNLRPSCSSRPLTPGDSSTRIGPASGEKALAMRSGPCPASPLIRRTRVSTAVSAAAIA